MPIALDTRFAHYQIISLLGAGGMGEVYRARDIRLDREVAIKVLPTSFSTDAERLRRFEQEAQATSALNHPNILTVYDIGTHEGAPFIVAELLEGEELREPLNEGPLSVRKAVEYAHQTAIGLAAAHEKGIVHRDLKPENLFITRDGRVKILDFGLAKLRPQKLAGGVDTQAATLKPLTDPGVVMGTVGYMSPEQVRGTEVDHRSDIFSFGLILYEMLKGESAFKRETMAETMTAILKEDLPDFGEGNTKISPQLEKLVRRCLEKRPERRFQTASDLAFALESVSIASTSGSAAVTLSSSGSPPTSAPALLSQGTSDWRARVGPWAGWIVAGIVTLALIALGTAYFRRPTPRGEPVRLSVTPPEKATTIGYPSLSPDGRMLAFLASTQDTTRVWVRPMNSATARLLADTDGAQWVFWSPDSQFIGFYAAGTLKRVAALGGTPVVLTESDASPGSTWNGDGVILFGTGREGIKRVSVNAGAVTTVTTVDTTHGEIGHSSPFFLPDSRHFVFHIQHHQPDKEGIYLSSLDGLPAKQLVSTDTRTSWAGENPDTPGKGYLVFVHQGALLAQAFDFGGMALSGEPVRLIDQVQANLLGQRGPSGQFSISGNVLAATEEISSQQLTWVDRAGRKVGTTGPVGAYGIRDLSPDDKQIAVTRYDPRTGTGDIWLIDVASGRETRFTVDPGNDSFPRWSRDGGRIVWASNRNGLSGLYIKSANGAGTEDLLFESASPKVPLDWTPDGRFILYRESDAQSGYDLWMLPLEGDRKPFPWLKTKFNESTGRGISPDGKWLAYSSTETGSSQFYIQALVPGAPASGAKWLISTDGGIMPSWRRDGLGLCYYNATLGKLMDVDVRLGATVEAGVPRELINLGPIHADMTRAWTMTRDEQRFLFVTSVEGSSAPPITVVMNWMSEIK